MQLVSRVKLFLLCEMICFPSLICSYGSVCVEIRKKSSFGTILLFENVILTFHVSLLLFGHGGSGFHNTRTLALFCSNDHKYLH